MIWRINSWEMPEEERGQALLARMTHPQLKTYRKQAVAALQKALASVLEPAGYQRVHDAHWQQSGLRFVTWVIIQKSRHGFSCSIDIGRDLRGEPKIPSYKPNTAWRLGRFERSIDRGNRIDQLYYVDLAEDPDFIPYLAKLLEERALPSLKSSHSLLAADFRPPRLPRSVDDDTASASPHPEPNPALETLRRAIGALVAPEGYELEPDGQWRRRGLIITTRVAVREAETGDACYILFGRDLRLSDMTDRARFGWLTRNVDDANRLNLLRYEDLNRDPALFAEVTELFRTKAIPALRGMHGLGGLLMLSSG